MVEGSAHRPINLLLLSAARDTSQSVHSVTPKSCELFLGTAGVALEVWGL